MVGGRINSLGNSTFPWDLLSERTVAANFSLRFSGVVNPRPQPVSGSGEKLVCSSPKFLANKIYCSLH